MERTARSALFVAVLGLALAPAMLPDRASAAGKRTASQASACIFDHMMLWTAPGTCRPHAVRYPRGVVGKTRRAIYDSALIFGVPYQVLLRIAACESGLDPHAQSGGYVGLFQFLLPTFLSGAHEMRLETGVTAHNVWKALDSSYVAGYLFAVGESPRWSCQ